MSTKAFMFKWHERIGMKGKMIDENFSIGTNPTKSRILIPDILLNKIITNISKSLVVETSIVYSSEIIVTQGIIQEMIAEIIQGNIIQEIILEITREMTEITIEMIDLNIPEEVGMLRP